jgi:hypothetical protein
MDGRSRKWLGPGAVVLLPHKCFLCWGRRRATCTLALPAGLGSWQAVWAAGC